MDNATFKTGQVIKFKGYTWKVLDPNCDGGILIVMNERWKITKFDDNIYIPENGDYPTNNYTYSTLREQLDEFASILGKDNFIKHEVDLTSNLNQKDYGSVYDEVFILSIKEVEHYMDYYGGWTCTPGDCHGDISVCCDADSDGWKTAMLPHTNNDVYPACVLNTDKVCVKENREYQSNIIEIKAISDSPEEYKYDDLIASLIRLDLRTSDALLISKTGSNEYTIKLIGSKLSTQAAESLSNWLKK